jgi:ribonuclease HII
LATDRYHFEKQLWDEGFRRVMGLDEVGRGCLCGPVVAAGVILDPGADENLSLKDSKSINKEAREDLSETIKETSRYWTIQVCTPEEIDKLNILHASLKAMSKCAESADADPDYLLVDGNKSPITMLPHACLVKGDDRSASIAAASILAKVYRDKLMVELHEKYPHFGWDRNVGYPTKEHFAGLEEFGYTKHHRKSFKLRTEKVYGS